MRRIATSWLVPLLLLAAPVLTTVLLAARPSAAATTVPRTLNGSYLWEQSGDHGRLEAVFTPAGDLHWNVSFHFKYGGGAHTFTGTADGHLDEGAITGRVESDGRRRTFTFRGEFRGGKFSGTHAEVMGNQEHLTGTLTMSAKS